VGLHPRLTDPVPTGEGHPDSAARRIQLPHLPRVTPSKLLMPALTGLGLWLVVEQLLGLGEIRGVLDEVTWAWVLVVLVVTQATAVTEAVAMTGAAPVVVPLGPLTLLRFALGFTGLVGGTVATTATVVRFFKQRDLEPAVALSSGILYSLSGFAVQILLTLLILPFVWDELHLTAAGPSGSGPEILHILLWALTIAGLVGGVVLTVPKLRRLVASRVKPQFASAWDNVRAVFRTPERVVRLLAGSAATQLLMAAGLGVALRAVGAHAGFGALVLICTFTALLGGMAPVPGGMGVMEACYISGLTLVGVPQDQAVAAVLLYRICTTYLPPVWGWMSLVWLRRRSYL
jgi:glycosyltransferase 2 family protein